MTIPHDIEALLGAIHGSQASRRETQLDAAIATVERVGRPGHDRLRQLVSTGYRQGRNEALWPLHEPTAEPGDSAGTDAAAGPTEAQTGEASGPPSPAAAPEVAAPPVAAAARPGLPKPAIEVYSGQGAEVVASRYATTQIIHRRRR